MTNANEWKEAGANYPETMRFEKGDSIIGILMERKVVAIEFGKGKKKEKKNVNCYIVDVKGTLRTIWGTGQLDYLLKDVKDGEEVNITYQGKIDLEDFPQPVHQYKVLHREVK